MSVIQSGSSFLITWSLTTPEAVTITRTSDTPDTELATLPAAITSYIDTVPGLADGDTVTWTIVGNVTMGSVDLSIVAGDPDDYAYTYGDIDPLATTIRYTTLAAVKTRLGISGTQYDTPLTQSIITAEIQLDQYCGRSFPDDGTNPAIEGIPTAIKEAATLAAMTVWKMGDAPTGYAGGDYLNEVDVARSLWQQFDRNPLLTGYHAAWGLA